MFTMRYLRLQRSQANRRRAEREAERAALQSRSQPAQGAPGSRDAPAPDGSTSEPRRRREN
ncbi:MAG: hypothetical protein DI561_03205 [Thauera sp.]|nr:MAG: hypothetical protein DI561_03205 [Thauera sp.]